MEKYSLVILCLMAIALAMPINAQSEETGKLTIIVTGLKNDNGVVRISLYDSEASYLGKGEAFKKTKVEIKNKVAICEFKDIPNGTYAVQLYHDENNNGQLDKNFLGIPKEYYGFSNNPGGKFGPPKYEKVKFVFESSKTIEIKVE